MQIIPSRAREMPRLRPILLALLLLTLALLPRPSVSQPAAGSRPSPMTIPLDDPLFWDPLEATGDYAVVEQGSRIYLLRPATGRVIARLQPPRGGAAPLLDPYGAGGRRDGDASLSSPPGWPFQPGDEVTTTPVVDDLDGDGSPEVVFATRTGWVWVLGRDGLPPAGWPVDIGANCHSSPALADLDRNGRLDILVGDALGRVHVLRIDGHPLAGWPAMIPGASEMPAIFGPIVVGDLDGDRSEEVIVSQASGRVCVFRSNGRPRAGWPVSTTAAEDPPNAGTIFTRAAIGDLDGDGSLEVIASANNYSVYVWDSGGRPRDGWPRRLENRGRAGYAAPVLADLDGDGRPEVLIATDQGFDGPARVYALDARGRNASGWPVDLPRRCNAGVAIGDLDEDGRPEIVAATVGDNGRVFAWNGRGRIRPGFPIGLSGMSVNTSPILADVDGDGQVDILLGATGTFFEPATILMAINSHGRPIQPFPIRVEGCEVVEGGLCVADLDGDGRLEALIGTEVQGQLLVWDLAGEADPRTTPWPRPGFDRSNSGSYNPAALDRPADRPAETEDAAIQGPPLDTPFSPLVSVSFVLLGEGNVALTVLDVVGEPIRTLLNTILPVGAYTISWDGTDGRGSSLPPGVYFYELETPGRRTTGQLLLLR